MSDFVRGAVGKTAIIAAFVLCAGLAAILFWEYWMVGKFANDFGVYWRTANNPVTSAYFYEGRFPFPYAPTMLLWISPLAFIPKWIAYFIFAGLSTLAFVLVVRPYLSKAALALTLISPPFVRGLYTGQVSALLAALTIWACGTANRVMAGVAFGVVASIKPQLVLMAPLMLALNRDWKAFQAAAATFVAIILLSLLFGPERWLEWVGSMEHFRSAVVDTPIIAVGVSPAVVAEKYGLPPIPFLILGTIAGAIFVYLCRDTEPLEKAAAITVGSLLAAPYALAYDLIAVVPFLAMMAMKGRIQALVAIAAMLNPLPLLISVYELLASREGRSRDRVAAV